jgi:sucrose phosphorylase
VGLLAGGNDLDLLRRTGVGRDVNRHYYTEAELHQDLQRPVVQALRALLRLRNTHPAFGGSFRLVPSPADALVLEWSGGTESARLDVNLAEMSASLACSGAGGGTRPAWRTVTE